MASIYTVLLSDGEGSPSLGYIAAAIVCILLVLLLASIAVFFLRRRKQKPPEAETSSRYGIEIKNNEVESSEANDNKEESSEANDDGTYLYSKTEIDEAPLPSHISLHKDSNLKEKSKDMASQIENLEEEFFNLVEYVEENVKNEKTIATQGDNKEHNRYIDIGTNQFNFPSSIKSCFSSF